MVERAKIAGERRVKLTEAERLFVDTYYANDQDLAKTRDALGYKTMQPVRMFLNRKPVQNALEKRRAAARRRVNISKDELLEVLLEIVHSSKLSAREKPTAIKAIETINKMLGFNTPDKVEVQQKQVVVHLLPPDETN